MTAGGTRREVLKSTGAISVGVVWGNIQNASTLFAQVDDSVTIDRTVGGDVYLPAEADATVTGTSTLDPNTELLVRLSSSGDNPFLKSQNTTVTDNGTWAASFDLSDTFEGQEFTITVSRNQEQLASAPGVIGTLSAALSFTNQIARDSGTLLIVDSARLEAGGFIAIYAGAATDRIIGVSEYLEAGRTYSNLEIRLDEEVIGQTTLVAMAHLDTDRDQTFDFFGDTSEDGPYKEDDQPVMDSATVTGPTPTPSPTERTPDDNQRPTPGADIVAGGTGGLFGLWFLRKAHSKLTHDDNDNGDNDNGDNHPPTAAIDLVPETPAPGQPVFFDGSRSTDPNDGDQVASYRWTVDDREVFGPRFVHGFLQDGIHEVRLQVFDTHRAADTAKKRVTVEVTEGELALDEAHPDSPDDDHEHLNEEYLVFQNVGDAALGVGGWTIHDTAEAEGRVMPGEHTFTFPDEFDLGPDERVTVHTGAKPEDSNSNEDADGKRHLYWNKPRAIWNNDEDVIVVEDGNGHPVLAMRYRRTESGTYELEDLDVEVLDGWFGRLVVSSREEAQLVSFVPAAGLVSKLVPGLVGMMLGATFLKGPKQFLYSWANVTGFFVSASVAWAATTVTGILPPSMHPIIPLLLVIGSVFMTVIGGIGVAVQYVITVVWGWIT